MSIEDLKATYIAARAARAETVKTYNRLFMALADKIEEMEADFQAVNAELLTKLKTQKENEAIAEEQLRQAVIDHCTANGVKTYDKNLGIRETVNLDYNGKLAVEWAKANAPIMVVESVEKKQFETFAKAQIAETDTNRIQASGLSFVRIEKTVTAVLKGV